jgi:hypothetical protein
MLWKQLWVDLPLKRTLCSFLPYLVLVVSWQVRFLTKIYHPNIDKVWSFPFPCSFFLCLVWSIGGCLGMSWTLWHYRPIDRSRSWSVRAD